MTPEAPAGISPILWLLIFLAVGPPALAWKFGKPLIDWYKARQTAKAEKGEAHAPSYRFSQAEVERIGRDYKRISEDYEKLIEENKERDGRIDALEEQVRIERRVTWKLAEYLRDVIRSHRTHAPNVDLPSPPELIEKYI